ncbi:M6PR [Branchiostoma lanceolatum]|uniref:Autophagy-related protein 27 n=1 Tax=Branchiostoma lanceolatum TaxID=7740 RepID=A0A8J9VXP6_BRALA|nr:M6PR [Branchiostoma lanceolatum]
MASRKGYLPLYLSAIVVVMIRPTLSATCFQTGPCSCDMDDGSGTIDLSALAGSGTAAFNGEATKWPDENWQYSYNPCTPFDMQSCYSVAACQVKSDGSGESYDIGSQDTVLFSMEGNDVVITYTANDYQRHTIVKLVCGSSTVFTVDGEDPDASTSFYFTLESPECCVKGSGPGPTGPNPGPGPTITLSISVGSIMCIVFFPTVCIYIVAGVLINKFAREREGRDVVPHLTFWSTLPGLIKDGFLFTWASMPCRKKGYTEI